MVNPSNKDHHEVLFEIGPMLQRRRLAVAAAVAREMGTGNINGCLVTNVKTGAEGKVVAYLPQLSRHVINMTHGPNVLKEPNLESADLGSDNPSFMLSPYSKSICANSRSVG